MIQRRRGLRFAFVTAILATIALWPGAVSAASCSGQSHDLALTSGAASPGSGSTATSFQFSVTYADNAGCAPTSIVVTVAGAGTFPLTFVSGDLTSGATFARVMTLPAGSHGYSFEAVSGSGAGERTVTLTAVTPGTVTVSSPTPKPTPAITPPPPPPPTPTITQPPPPPSPTPAATPSPGESATPGPTAGSPTPGASPGDGGGTTDPTASGPPGASASAGHALAAGPPGDRSTGASAFFEPAVEEPAPAPAAANPGEGAGPLEELAVAGVGTVVGLGLFMLLSIRLLGTGLALRPMTLAGARVAGAPADVAVEVRPVPDLLVGTIVPVVDDDAAGPFAMSREPMRFGAPPAKGIDRCRVVSRLVALRREPDELSWPHPDRLDVGDEVDVLRQDGTHCYVRTPHGLEGWVPGLTLSGMKPPEPEPGAEDGG
jgi:hypothetical protein